VPETLRADLHVTRRAEDIMNRHFEVLPASRGLHDLSISQANGRGAFLVTGDSGGVCGVITAESAARLDHANALVAAREFAQSNYAAVAPSDSLWDVVAAMRDRGTDVALVVSKNGRVSAADVQGLITREQIIDALGSNMELFGD
jgi:predicted transcriptional regulator